jgi:hypothetical protein
VSLTAAAPAQGLPIESISWGLDKATGDFKVRAGGGVSHTGA